MDVKPRAANDSFKQKVLTQPGLPLLGNHNTATAYHLAGASGRRVAPHTAAFMAAGSPSPPLWQRRGGDFPWLYRLTRLDHSTAVRCGMSNGEALQGMVRPNDRKGCDST